MKYLKILLYCVTGMWFTSALLNCLAFRVINQTTLYDNPLSGLIFFAPWYIGHVLGAWAYLFFNKS